MIKIDYEGAWKGLKEKYGDRYIGIPGGSADAIGNVMTDLERQHTQNIIKLKHRNDKDRADYCMQKYAEVYAENVNLKRKLGEQRKKYKIFKVHIVGVTDDNYEYSVTENMNEERVEYYENAVRGEKEVKYRGKKIRMVALDVTYPSTVEEVNKCQS